MPGNTVIPFPSTRATAPVYSETAALNDIHAIMCRRGGPDPGTLEDIAQVLARCGRPVLEIRDIDASVTQTPAGLPEALVDAGDTKVAVCQDQAGGLIVAITATAADEAQLTVTLGRRQLHPAAPGGPPPPAAAAAAAGAPRCRPAWAAGGGRP